MRMKKMILIAIGILYMSSGLAWGITYYVDGNNGNDNADGLTLETAFKTIQKALDYMDISDDVLIRGGIVLQLSFFLA